MLNRFLGQGRLTSDPELRQTESGFTYTRIAIAIPQAFNKKETDFIDITCWGKTAEFVAKYFKKGQQIIVDGPLHSRNWTDESGVKHKIMEVTAREVHFAGDKAGKKDDDAFHEMEEDDGNLPF